ncbi:MAG: hypothetical protein ABIO44_00345 [Saprospiraceae bacterium]
MANINLNRSFTGAKIFKSCEGINELILLQLILYICPRIFDMWRYAKLFILFFFCCFFLLPLLNIEDPIRTISLSLLGKETDAHIVEHICKPDRTYWYEYISKGKSYRQQYNGYVVKLDEAIQENSRCQGILPVPAEIKIRVFPYYSYWSEPVDHILVSDIEKFMYILIKIIGIWILLFTFIRK